MMVVLLEPIVIKKKKKYFLMSEVADFTRQVTSDRCGELTVH